MDQTWTCVSPSSPPSGVNVCNIVQGYDHTGRIKIHLLPILQSMMQGDSKYANRSSMRLYSCSSLRVTPWYVGTKGLRLSSMSFCRHCCSLAQNFFKSFLSPLVWKLPTAVTVKTQKCVKPKFILDFTFFQEAPFWFDDILACCTRLSQSA